MCAFSSQHMRVQRDTSPLLVETVDGEGEGEGEGSNCTRLYSCHFGLTQQQGLTKCLKLEQGDLI